MKDRLTKKKRNYGKRQSDIRRFDNDESWNDYGSKRTSKCRKSNIAHLLPQSSKGEVFLFKCKAWHCKRCAREKRKELLAHYKHLLNVIMARTGSPLYFWEGMDGDKTYDCLRKRRHRKSGMGHLKISRKDGSFVYITDRDLSGSKEPKHLKRISTADDLRDLLTYAFRLPGMREVNSSKNWRPPKRPKTKQDRILLGIKLIKQWELDDILRLIEKQNPLLKYSDEEFVRKVKEGIKNRIEKREGRENQTLADVK